MKDASQEGCTYKDEEMMSLGEDTEERRECEMDEWSVGNGRKEGGQDKTKNLSQVGEAVEMDDS